MRINNIIIWRKVLIFSFDKVFPEYKIFENAEIQILGEKHII